MRITNFLYSTIYKFAPMSDKDSAELEKDAMQSYSRILNESFDIRDIKARNAAILLEAEKITDEKAKEKHLEQIIPVPKETLAHKLALLSENWLVRTFLAIFHIWLIPQIQAYMNGNSKSEPDDDAYDDVHDDDDDYIYVKRRR